MIKYFFSFLSDPYSCLATGQSETIREKFVLLRKIYLIAFCTSIVVILLTHFIDLSLQQRPGVSVYQNLVNNRNDFRQANSALNVFLKMNLIGPLNEELLYRSLLISEPYFLRFGILFVFIEYFIPAVFQFSISSYWYSLFLILCFGGVMIFEKCSTKGDPVFKGKTYNYFVWSSTLAFAISHLSNFFPLNGSVILLFPILVFPQLIYGIALSYVAVRYNSIVWPFLLHVAINLTPEIPRWLNVLLHEFI